MLMKEYNLPLIYSQIFREYCSLCCHGNTSTSFSTKEVTSLLILTFGHFIENHVN